MTDDMTVAQRSYTMSRILSGRNRSTELRLLRLLRTARLSGWRRDSGLPGHPDFVFPKMHVALFVDGCFWHGCPRCRLRSKSNRDYWQSKIAGNAARDKIVTRELQAAGWLVIRIWEHAIRARPEACVERIRSALEKAVSA